MDLGLLQRQVAVLIGVDTTAVTNWEKGRTVPAPRLLLKIAEFLGYAPPEPVRDTLDERLRAARRRAVSPPEAH